MGGGLIGIVTPVATLIFLASKCTLSSHTKEYVYVEKNNRKNVQFVSLYFYLSMHNTAKHCGRLQFTILHQVLHTVEACHPIPGSVE